MHRVLCYCVGTVAAAIIAETMLGAVGVKAHDNNMTGTSPLVFCDFYVGSTRFQILSRCLGAQREFFFLRR